MAYGQQRLVAGAWLQRLSAVRASRVHVKRPGTRVDNLPRVGGKLRGGQRKRWVIPGPPRTVETGLEQHRFSLRRDAPAAE